MGDEVDLLLISPEQLANPEFQAREFGEPVSRAVGTLCPIGPGERRSA